MIKVQCFFRGQPALFTGVDPKKWMYRIRLQDGTFTYLDSLQSITFRDHTVQTGLFEGVGNVNK